MKTVILKESGEFFSFCCLGAEMENANSFMCKILYFLQGHASKGRSFRERKKRFVFEERLLEKNSRICKKPIHSSHFCSYKSPVTEEAEF